VIRGRDQVRLSVQKLGLRKKRAAFAIVSVALGVIVVTTVNSLMQGVRDVATKTMWSEELDKDVIRIYANDNPYEDIPGTEPTKQKTKKHYQFLTDGIFEEIRGWSEVEAADRPVVVENVSIDVFAKRPRPVSQLQGVPEALLRRYVQDAVLLAQTSNAIPVVIGERNVRLRFDEKTKKLELDSSTNSWVGREITITVGDNFANLRRFRYDYGKRQFQQLSKEEIASAREAMERNMRGAYDQTIYKTVLSLRARVVGLCPGNDVLVPLDTAVLCEKWLDQRSRLASLAPPSSSSDGAAYDEERGRRAPRAGEYREGIVVVKRGANIEAVAKRIEGLGFYAATRERTFENQVKAFDAGMRVVKKVLFAFGALILGLACGLVWSTTSRVVSDSRVDIGLFRALGATKTDIRRLFLSEAVLLGMLGTLVGMLIGWALAAGISQWVLGFARRSVVDPEDILLLPNSIFAVDFQFALLLLAGAAFLSLLAGWLPAGRAANVDPVKALKRE
jgi:ABC-type lipoprotein release transport system permease subunit